MRLYIIITALAMSSAVFAQTSAKDSIAAFKAAQKEAKALKAAQLKAFKEKQKADLAAFTKAQQENTTGAAVTLPAVELKDAGDSLAHIFGIAQSNGLKGYMVNQLGVDTAYIAEFCKGIMDAANIDPQNKEKAAYSAGEQIGGQVVNMSKNLSKEYYAADPDKSINAGIVAHGLIEGLLGTNKIGVQEAGQQLQQAVTARQAENKEKLWGANRKAGEQFLAENRTKEGVHTTTSGLQYKVLTEGKGAIPQKTDKVKVNYEGTLIDGTVFDSSIKRGQPATFQVNQVIKGWTEALCMMPVGSKWELYIPQELAYGDRETGNIKPYSTLIFTVELLDIEK
jgi:FKBP-type peptidyl-prolyl cis-trans isomerase FklB